MFERQPATMLRVNLFTQLANDATHLPTVRQAARKYRYAVNWLKGTYATI